MNISDQDIEKVYNSLLKLVLKVFELTIEHRDNGNLESIPSQYIPVKEMDYENESFYYDWDNIKYFTTYDWHYADFSDFLDNKVKILDEFEQAGKLLASTFDVPEFNAKNIGLFTLVRAVMKLAPNDRINNDNIPQYINYFIDSCKTEKSDSLLTWNIELWLGNIYIESEEIELDKNTFLRRPQKNQLADFGAKASYIDKAERMFGKRMNAGAIIYFSKQAEGMPTIGGLPDPIRSEVENWSNILRLFKPTDLIVLHQISTPVSIFEHSYTDSKQQRTHGPWHGKVDSKDLSNYKLYIKTSEMGLLKQFVSKMSPIMSSMVHKTYLLGSPYDIALNRYNDSLLVTDVNAYRIVSSITSFEAIFRRDKTDKSYKIVPRICKLLDCFGISSLESEPKIKLAYNLRNALLHGDESELSETDLLEFARNHSHEIINYNRICVLVFLQLRELLTKSQFIEKLELSLSTEVADTELRNLIKENVFMPIIDPYVRSRLI